MDRYSVLGFTLTMTAVVVVFGLGACRADRAKASEYELENPLAYARDIEAIRRYEKCVYFFGVVGLIYAGINFFFMSGPFTF